MLAAQTRWLSCYRNIEKDDGIVGMPLGLPAATPCKNLQQKEGEGTNQRLSEAIDQYQLSTQLLPSVFIKGARAVRARDDDDAVRDDLARLVTVTLFKVFCQF